MSVTAHGLQAGRSICPPQTSQCASVFCATDAPSMKQTQTFHAQISKDCREKAIARLNGHGLKPRPMKGA
ncbi:hypothetical protein GWA01_14600 [Gluconobacter wancherniae NBRC 103581]|uniref:Uncharacterized protein n=1 Tax=Gluconobacter wancherniae NBRC 103581 TaxID=656744 RepID=A0A511AZR0_9PROT|nr:hypothetical protein AA103581_0518 [Gluconobacter wancherniae NBRC 103581]GEK93690.1 hypothetical protein GWA01_14600 [Gluconobacter wancherniae NBRC 103581]